MGITLRIDAHKKNEPQAVYHPLTDVEASATDYRREFQHWQITDLGQKMPMVKILGVCSEMVDFGSGQGRS